MSTKNTRNSRATFRRLATLCDAMVDARNAGDIDAMGAAWDEAYDITSSGRMSDYESAIACAFDEYDRYVTQSRYMDEHRDEWGYDRFRLEQRDLEKYAHATCAQQDLIRHIFMVDEEVIHGDLETWLRYIDLFHEVANITMRHRYEQATRSAS